MPIALASVLMNQLPVLETRRGSGKRESQQESEQRENGAFGSASSFGEAIGIVREPGNADAAADLEGDTSMPANSSDGDQETSRPSVKLI